MSGTCDVSSALSDIDIPSVLARDTLTSRCICTAPLLLTLTLFRVPAVHCLFRALRHTLTS